MLGVNVAHGLVPLVGLPDAHQVLFLLIQILPASKSTAKVIVSPAAQVTPVALTSENEEATAVDPSVGRAEPLSLPPPKPLEPTSALVATPICSLNVEPPIRISKYHLPVF